MKRDLSLRQMIIAVLSLLVAIVLGGVAASHSALAQNKTVTLSLFKGTHAAADVYYIITDSSDQDDAEARGVNWAPRG